MLTPAGLDKTKIVDQKCYGAVLDAFNQPADQVIAHNPSEVPPFPELFALDTPGKTPTAAPMLVYQGLSDDVVYKVFTDAYVDKACALGNTVEYKEFSGKDHYEENDAAEKDVLEWMQARLAGIAAPSSCAAARGRRRFLVPRRGVPDPPWPERARNCTRTRNDSDAR